MIWAKFYFLEGALWQALSAIDRLPSAARPTHFCFEEGDPRTDDNRFVLDEKFAAWVARHGSFLLEANGAQWSIWRWKGVHIDCHCFLDVDGDVARAVVSRLAPVGIIFGYACCEAELYWRNNIYVRFAGGSSKTWVGRDYQKYIPGLYWTTLISEDLASQHGVSLADLAADAVEHEQISGGGHMFRFYNRPEDWSSHKTRIDQLCSSMPGFFDVGAIRRQVEHVTSEAERRRITSRWP